jgi:hypothetical protein
MKRFLFCVLLGVALVGLGCDIMDQDVVIYPDDDEEEKQDEEEEEAKTP